MTSLPFFLCAGFDTSQMAVAIGRRAGRLVQQLMKQNRKTFYGQLQEHNEAAALLSNYIHRAHLLLTAKVTGKKYIFIYSVVRYRPLIFY